MLSVAFSDDSQTIVSSDDRGIMKVWNAEGREILSIKAPEKGIRRVQFFPSQKSIVSMSESGVAKLWLWDLEKLMQQGCTLAKHYLSTDNAEITDFDRNMCKVSVIGD